MEQKQLFKIRDLRKKDQFKIDDKYLNGYARICGPNATLVYLSLCRHAEFNSQKAFPSQNKIGYELRISIASVKRGIKSLLEYNIIRIEKEKMGGKFTNNVYYLVDKSEWNLKDTIAPKDTRYHSSETVAHTPPTVRDTYKDNKVLRITKKKDNKDIYTSFNCFFDLYEKKVGKKKTLAKWLKLSDKDRKLAISYLPAYVESTPDKRFRKNPETFLNNRSWEDEIIQNENNVEKPFNKLFN